MTTIDADGTLPLVGAGRDADVFAFDQQRVLRRYRRGGDTAAEAAVMRHVAGFGFPVPEVYEAAGADLVMQRLHGASLLHLLMTAEASPAAGAAILADLHQRLHAVPPLRTAGPEERILHLDLHPDNVVVTAEGPVLIDWRNAAQGPPDLDVALTALLIAEAVVGSHLPPELRPMAQEMLTGFLAAVGGGPARQLEEAAARRRRDPNLSQDEVSRLVQAADRVRQVIG